MSEIPLIFLGQYLSNAPKFDDHQILCHGHDFVDGVASVAAAVVATIAATAIDASVGTGFDHGCSLTLGIFTIAGTRRLGRCPFHGAVQLAWSLDLKSESCPPRFSFVWFCYVLVFSEAEIVSIWKAYSTGIGGPLVRRRDLSASRAVWRNAGETQMHALGIHGVYRPIHYETLIHLLAS
ncbi:hypothetical protein QQP08_018233 [Theobroma cacao]|nr:hypothetical protein QQP08_018233 [Theobroma cacao]